MELRAWLREISVPVYLTIFVFAWSSWIDINGVWVELPLMINDLPEYWNLPSYLVVIIQVANVGPLLFTLANRLWPARIKEWPVVYVIIAIGFTSCLLLVFFWDRTSVIGGELHSTGLLTLSCLLALVDCTSSVVYLPYMSIFKPQYLTAFYIGEGLGGFIPGIVGLIQGVGSDPECVNFTVVETNATTGENHTRYEVWPVYDPPRFTIEVFYGFLCGMVGLSGIAFTLLHFVPYYKREHSANSRQYTLQNAPESTNEKSVSYYNNAGYNNAYDSTDVIQEKTKPHRDDDGKDPDAPDLTLYQLTFFLTICAWSNAMTNGVIPSTQSYTCLPYGNRAYNLSVRLSTVANPLACFLALFVATRSMVVTGVLALLGSVITGYHLYLAAMSPAPPLQDDVWGEIIVIATSVLMIGFYSYIKVCVASLVVTSLGRRGLLWVGVATQVGSLVGSISTFMVVNVAEAFTDMPACPV